MALGLVAEEGRVLGFTLVPGPLLILSPPESEASPPSLLQVTNRGEAHLELNAFRRKHDCALVISGDSLEVGMGTLESQELWQSCRAELWAGRCP